MRKSYTITLSLLAILTLYSNIAMGSGVLVDIQGEVKLQDSDGKAMQAIIGNFLEDGSIVKTEKNSSASIMLNDGSFEEITEKQKYKIGETTKNKKEKTIISGITLAMNEATSNDSGPTVHGMIKMTNLGPDSTKPQVLINPFAPKASFPVGTAITYTKQIDFEWDENSKFNFASPVIIIEDTKKKKLATKPIIPGKNKITITTSELKLAKGNTYNWYFASKDKGKFLGKSQRLIFQILSDKEESRLNKDINIINSMSITKPGKDFLIAQLYYKHKMYHKTVKLLVPLYEINKTNLIKTELYYSFARMNNGKEAEKYR